jgi:hypothetical protein
MHRAALGTATALFVAARPAEAIAAVEPPVAAAPLEPATPTTTSHVPPRPRPIPAWKIAGLATSATFAAVFFASALGTSLALRFTYRKKLLDAVDGSQTDANPNNDISRSAPNLCAAARATPPGEPNPNKVTNAAVTRICNEADGLKITSNAMWAMTGIGLAATTVFAVLLVVRRADKQRRVSLRIDGMPGRFMLGLAGRF